MQEIPSDKEELLHCDFCEYIRSCEHITPQGAGNKSLRDSIFLTLQISFILCKNYIEKIISKESYSISDNEKLIDVLDDEGIRTGEILSRKEIHELGKVHRAVHLYLFDKSNNILLQRRSYNVDHYPGALSISLTGHIDTGESSMKALRREIKEELKLDPYKMEIEFLFSFKQYAQISPTYIDRQFNDIYACWHDFKISDISYDSKELSEIKFLPFSDFSKMVLDENSELALVYLREYKDVVYFLQSKLSISQ